jgi:hypothetical protein
MIEGWEKAGPFWSIRAACAANLVTVNCFNYVDRMGRILYFVAEAA